MGRGRLWAGLAVVWGIFWTVFAIPAAQAETKLGVSFDRFDDVFISQMRDAMLAYLKTHPEISATVLSADNSVEKQAAQVNTFVEQKVNALVVMAVDESKAKAMADRAGHAGIPIVFFSRRLPENSFVGPTTMVSSNDLVAGRLQMRYLAAQRHGTAKVAVLKGLGSAAAARTQGFMEVLKGQPGMRVVTEGVGEWQRAKAKAIVAGWLKAGTDFDVIAANNDEMAIGAVEALQEAGMEPGKVLVGGVDATAAGLQALKSGYLTVTVKQAADKIAQRAIDDAVKLAGGQFVPLYDWVPFELVTPNNLSSYLPK